MNEYSIGVCMGIASMHIWLVSVDNTLLLVVFGFQFKRNISDRSELLLVQFCPVDDPGTESVVSIALASPFGDEVTR